MILARLLVPIAVCHALMPNSTLAAISRCDAPTLVLDQADRDAVITNDHLQARSVKFGFEGGRAIRVGTRYHIFTSEMMGRPMWVKMALGHWSSADGRSWQRVGTVFESSADFTGRDRRAALWSPIPIFDKASQRWNLFYVAYRSEPSRSERWLINYEGRIWRAVSRTPGYRGIAGPYRDAAVIMQPGPLSQAWEGLQGVDSFFPYQVGRRWFAFYGSAKTEVPQGPKDVGLAVAPALTGPWTRRAAGNPLRIESATAGSSPVFLENPIVTKIPGGYIAVYDNEGDGTIGYSFSRDGVSWTAGRSVRVTSADSWTNWVRTPLGLIQEGGGRYTVFYTGYRNVPERTEGENFGDGGVGMARLRLQGAADCR